MSEMIRGMRYFHICTLGACKQPGLYQTKNGECYCSKCAIKYIDKHGLKDFWPNYLNELIDLYNLHYETRNVEDINKYVESIYEKEERESKQKINKKSRKK